MCVSWSTSSSTIFYAVLFIFPTFSALTNWLPKGPPSFPFYEMGVPLWNPLYPLLREILSIRTGQLRTNVLLVFLHQSMAILLALQIRQIPCSHNHPGFFLSHPIIHRQTLVAETRGALPSSLPPCTAAGPSKMPSQCWLSGILTEHTSWSLFLLHWILFEDRDHYWYISVR